MLTIELSTGELSTGELSTGRIGNWPNWQLANGRLDNPRLGNHGLGNHGLALAHDFAATRLGHGRNKLSQTTAMRDHLVLYLNGKRQTVRGAQAALTLTDYLRGGLHGGLQAGFDSGSFAPGDCTARLPGTKVACAEGDCGACTVLVGKPSVDNCRFEYQTIDACIAFVYQMDRCHVITVEGLQNEAALTDVQRAMVDCHGSQCGFCTPGFVVALHGLIEQRNIRRPETGQVDTAKADPEQANTAHREAAQRTDQRTSEPPRGDQLDDDELRLGLSGNLCRCTGYAQILEAGLSLQLGSMTSVDQRFDTSAMLADLIDLGPGPVHVNARSAAVIRKGAGLPTPAPEVFLPDTLDQLLARRAQRPAATLVAGATDLGVQHNHGKIMPTDILVTRGVEALQQLDFDQNVLVIGAAVSWSRIEAFVRDRLPEYYQILTRFGSPQVRHAGTLVGNLANASPIADSIPFHYVAGSTLELASVGGRRQVAIEAFYLGYKQLDLRPDEVIVSVRTPLPTANEQLKLYKISKRRDMDISTVTAAFWIETEDQIVRTVRIATGGVGPTVVRLPRAEALIVGKELTLETMLAAGRMAREEIAPISDVRGHANYRYQLVENLFVKCFHDLASAPQLAGI